MEAQLAKAEWEKSAKDRTSGQVCMPRLRGHFFSQRQHNKFQCPSLMKQMHLIALLGVTAQTFVALNGASGQAELLSFRMTTPPNLSISSSS